MLLIGDCREEMKKLIAQGVKVQMCVTSPPYFGLRDYQVEGQLGLEKTPEEYVATLVEVFRLVRELLRDDGTCWINLGSSYAGSGGAHKPEHANPGLSRSSERGGVPHEPNNQQDDEFSPNQERKESAKIWKPKDLINIPFMVAEALREDGWWLRQDIIWSKLNPMPESVTDRCTKSHEYIFLLAKNPKYYFDNEAIREESKPQFAGKSIGLAPERDGNLRHDGGRSFKLDGLKGANRRSVWTIATKPYKGSHFATFPPEIPEICIKAGTSQKGCCPDCRNPWVRVVEKKPYGKEGWAPAKKDHTGKLQGSQSMIRDGVGAAGFVDVTTIGWRPTCSHNLPPAPCTVFDPFLGSGTTGQVAEELGRDWIGIELNPKYEPLIKKRTRKVHLGL